MLKLIMEVNYANKFMSSEFRGNTFLTLKVENRIDKMKVKFETNYSR